MILRDDSCFVIFVFYPVILIVTSEIQLSEPLLVLLKPSSFNLQFLISVHQAHFVVSVQIRLSVL